MQVANLIFLLHLLLAMWCSSHTQTHFTTTLHTKIVFEVYLRTYAMPEQKLADCGPVNNLIALQRFTLSIRVLSIACTILMGTY